MKLVTAATKAFLKSFEFLFCLFNMFIKKNGGHGIVKELLEILEKTRSVFVTYHLRPMSSSSISSTSDRTQCRKKLGVVVQGPIVGESGFTLDTLKLYRKIFNRADIILSTWEDEDGNELKKIKGLGVELVINRKPEYSGQSNINLQIVSSNSGVEKAKELGAEYVLKTRTDQRIYAPDVSHFLFNMTEVFPARGGNGTQKKRIVGVSLNTFRYRMYGLSDMLIYGHVDDMARFWGAPLDDRVFTEEFIDSRGKSLRIFANWRVCEVYLATEFLQQVGHVPEWTLADSWKAFSNHFCVVDKEQLDLFWPKYNRLEYRSLSYDEFNTKREMTFRDWLNIYKDLGNISVPEQFLDVPL